MAGVSSDPKHLIMETWGVSSATYFFTSSCQPCQDLTPKCSWWPSGPLLGDLPTDFVVGGGSGRSVSALLGQASCFHSLLGHLGTSCLCRLGSECSVSHHGQGMGFILEWSAEPIPSLPSHGPGWHLAFCWVRPHRRARWEGDGVVYKLLVSCLEGAGGLVFLFQHKKMACCLYVNLTDSIGKK